MDDIDCDCDCDCDFGDCDCDFDGCCCCGDDCDCDLGACCCGGFSSDDQTNVICIDFHGHGKHNEDPGCWCCYCCCHEDTPMRRESTETYKGPKPEKMDKKRDEKRKKKDSTCCFCHEPNSQGMPECPKCGRPSSISPSLDPPMIQRFQWPDREKYVPYNRQH
uniref:Pentatricopeptide repeat-containing protein At3g18110ic n=2 Tax=Rhizophora mucronata TaxID=61149 RepID=A0A2P2KL35_RHIMU